MLRRVGDTFENLTDALHMQAPMGSFERACLPEKYSISGHKDVYIESRGYGHWAISHCSSVLARDGYWEYEPFPSSRTQDFIKRTRWNSAQEAFEFFRSRPNAKGVWPSEVE